MSSRPARSFMAEPVDRTGRVPWGAEGGGRPLLQGSVDALDPILEHADELALQAQITDGLPTAGDRQMEFAHVHVADPYMNDARRGSRQEDSVREVGVL